MVPQIEYDRLKKLETDEKFKEPEDETTENETVTIPKSDYMLMKKNEFKYSRMTAWSEKGEIQLFCRHHRLLVEVKKDLVHVSLWKNEKGRVVQQWHRVTVSLVHRDSKKTARQETVVCKTKRQATSKAYLKMYIMLAREGAFDWIRYFEDGTDWVEFSEGRAISR
jgi:hypothetical protein